MSMTDLVSRLLEAITAKEEKAEAAKALHVYFDTGRRNGKATLYAFLNDNDPASVLRRCAADRKQVEAHKPRMRDSDEYDENGVLDYVEIPFCPTCWHGKSCSCCAPPVTADSYPCDPLRWLAEAYGLEVTE